MARTSLAVQLEQSNVAYEKLASDFASLKADNAAVLEKIAALMAAKPAAPAAKAHQPHADCECGKCGGSGWYDQVEQRICFACEGKGYQNDADQRRNWGYARFHKAAVPATATAAAKPAYVPKAPTTEVLAMRERMAVAKAAAIAGGKAVLV